MKPFLANCAEFAVIDFVEFERQFPPVFLGKPIKNVSPSVNRDFAEMELAFVFASNLTNKLKKSLHQHFAEVRQVCVKSCFFINNIFCWMLEKL
jgi:hypothetical protein